MSKPMIRILITGMSGTGKSTVIQELATRGFKAVDVDTAEWSEWIDDTGPAPGKDWVWREDRIRGLLAVEDADALFVSDCSSNLCRFYGRFDKIVLLTAPIPVITERVADRKGNAYGASPADLKRIIAHVETVEPILRRTSEIEIDTTASLDQVVAAVLDVVPRCGNNKRKQPFRQGGCSRSAAPSARRRRLATWRLGRLLKEPLTLGLERVRVACGSTTSPSLGTDQAVRRRLQVHLDPQIQHAHYWIEQ